MDDEILICAKCKQPIERLGDLDENFNEVCQDCIDDELDEEEFRRNLQG